MPGSGSKRRYFASSAHLQDFLLTLSPAALIIVPQSRLAHQIWRRQRLAAREAGITAWEPLTLMTLGDWWRRLAEQLWLPQPLAKPLQRLALWQQALETVPRPVEVDPDLNWAAAFEETHTLLQRYRLLPDPEVLEDPLFSWREQVRDCYRRLLAEADLLDPTAIPDLLMQALAAGQLPLPPEVYVVGLETPAVVEQEWFAAVARHGSLVFLELYGGEAVEVTAVTLPDQHQEIAWSLTQAVELARKQGVPWRRIGITAPTIEDYLPELQRCCQELFGEAEGPEGGFYNLSLGPRLVEAPLFQAALLPLKFLAGGENRADFCSWLLSPYYGAFQGREPVFCHWDRRWREEGWDTGLQAYLRAQVQGDPEDAACKELATLVQLLELLPAKAANAATWRESLLHLWQRLGFPRGCSPEEREHWQKVQELLVDLSQALGPLPLTAAQYQEWLHQGAKEVDLPSAGSSEVGLQVQGLLEMRGLDFAAVFCLGLNQGQLPQPPRPLPLLSPAERRQVLGGTYESQQEFAEIAFRYLRAAAPKLICTRPKYLQEEEQTPSYLVRQPWQEEQFPLLAQPHPLWLRAAAVRAIWQPAPATPALTCFTVSASLPSELSLTAVSRGLACPCQFFLGVLLQLEELPEAEPGLAPVARGALIHKVVEHFTRKLAPKLAALGYWDQDLAWETLEEVLTDYQELLRRDPHWEAELGRWLDEETGLLRTWLQAEAQRFQEGWRWLVMEEPFAGLQLAGIPFRLQGRLDRVDWHPEEGLVVWDYKTGNLPKAEQLLSEPRQLQLVGGIWAVSQGLVTIPPEKQGATVRAGFIGLKSSRRDHLRFEDYRWPAEHWDKIAAERLTALQLLAARLQQGDFRPLPQPAPAPRNLGACEYCPFPLVCNFTPETVEAEE